MSSPVTRPTLEQVAAAAEVSVATASKALNGRPGVSAETRRRVEDAIDRLGYVPTTGARAGAAPRSVVVVFRTMADVYALRVLEGILASARDHGLEVLLDALDLHGETADHARPDASALSSTRAAASSLAAPLSEAWIRRQAAPDRAGVVLVTAELTADQQRLLAARGVAAVHIDPANPRDDSTVSVGSTNFAGGVQATEHLLGLGHRRIAFAGGAASFLPSAERLQGYLSAMRAHGGDVDDALIHARAHTFEAGVEMAEALLDAPRPPTAVFAASDSIALGVLAAAQRRGVRVPGDLSVVGFDDSAAAAGSAPALTTVRQPIVEMGRVAVRTVVQLSRRERVDSHHVQLATSLVVRESTAPPAPA